MKRATWIIIFVSRLLINVSYRLTYPYLPAIARGLGVSFERAGLLVAARSLVGICSMIAGPLTEKKGYRWVLLAAMVLFIMGSATVASAAGFWIACIGFVLLGLAKALYDPTAQSYVSANTSRRKRAQGIGFIESSWSSSWLLGIPLCGLIIAHIGWRGPFWTLGLLAVPALLLTRNLEQPACSFTGDQTATAPPHQSSPSVLLRHTPVLVMFTSLFMLAANENLIIVYGAYLESVFDLKIQALGFYSAIMGAAEFCGEISVALFVDRIGKGKAFLGGLSCTTLSYLLLPLCGTSMQLTLGILALMFFFFEFTVVTSFSFVSELGNGAAAKWLAINYSSCIAGRLVGALTGPWLWQGSEQLWPIVLLSTAINLAALVFLVAAMRRRPPGVFSNARR